LAQFARRLLYCSRSVLYTPQTYGHQLNIVNFLKLIKLENKLYKVEDTVNDRIKILISKLGVSARAFSQILEVPESTTRNYLDKNTKPSVDYIERISKHFDSVNIAWLITGSGTMFIGEVPPVANTTTTRIKKVTGGAVHSGNGNQLITLEACQQELEQTKRDLASLQREIELLTGQLQTKDALIASKEETIDLLKAAFNRPN
jgi:hypothetical protein